MEEDRILNLLIKKKAGSITLPELIELSDLLKTHPERAVEENILDEYFSSAIKIEGVSEDFIDSSTNKLTQLIQGGAKTSKKKGFIYSFPKFATVAALVLATVGAAVFMLAREHNTKPSKFVNVITTRNGSKSDLILPDGTKVWVNAGSRLSYSKSYGDELREVFLTGEAFFNVAEDKKHPFVVRTKYMDVRALGTEFNVKAYNNDAAPQTTLIRGSVEVLVKESKDKIILKPYEKLIVQNNSINDNDKIISYKSPSLQGIFLLVKTQPNVKDSMVLETQWIQNKLVFEKQNISELLSTLERWYDVKIVVKNKNVISNNLLSGTFDNDGLADVLESLKLSAGIKYKISKDSVLIY